MKKIKSPYNTRQRISSFLMMVALLWLTVSIPFVNAAKEHSSFKSAITSAPEADEDQSCNPYGNNTEEKAPSGANSFSEEFLHHSDELLHAAELFLSHTRFHTVSEYAAFHGEMLCPPPNKQS